MGWDRFTGALANAAVLACAALGAAAASAQAEMPGPGSEIPHTRTPTNEIMLLLHMQNAERVRLGLAPLGWSDQLAEDANSWAKVLMQRGEPEHSPASDRKGQGENIWMGTQGVWSAESMMEMFLEERRHFRSAPFPDVSSTGNWVDVGHYSQIVWRETTQVGCALVTGNGMDVLVCRYSPAGNVYGQKPF